MRDKAEWLEQPQAGGGASVARCLQGVQHCGITVQDMAKSLEFYTEVLGGRVALSGDGFYGEVLHNTLFQKEDLEALERGVDPRTLIVPDLRDGTREALDVRFISFGNTCVELLHFRGAKEGPWAPNWGPRLPSGVGSTMASHLSFHVRDDVDLNRFAQWLEEECRRRDISGVVCNRILRVRSEEERQRVEPRYRANKFWNDPEYPVPGYSESDFGDFHGWSLFYCKGPSGEQLEFNQVTRSARDRFMRAQREYNASVGTRFPWAPGEAAPGRRSEIVKIMYEAAEEGRVEDYIRHFTEDALYQVGNAPAARGPKGIQAVAASVMGQVERVSHRLKRLWEVEDSVFCDMDVTYVRRDGKQFTLPCFDIAVFEGDKVRELRVYVDVSPVFAD